MTAAEFKPYVYCASCNAENRRGDAVCFACSKPLPGHELDVEAMQTREEEKKKHEGGFFSKLFGRKAS